eukprot:UC4_evm1s979
MKPTSSPSSIIARVILAVAGCLIHSVDSANECPSYYEHTCSHVFDKTVGDFGWHLAFDRHGLNDGGVKGCCCRRSKYNKVHERCKGTGDKCLIPMSIDCANADEEGETKLVIDASRLDGGVTDSVPSDRGFNLALSKDNIEKSSINAQGATVFSLGIGVNEHGKQEPLPGLQDLHLDLRGSSIPNIMIVGNPKLKHITILADNARIDSLLISGNTNLETLCLSMDSTLIRAKFQVVDNPKLVRLPGLLASAGKFWLEKEWNYLWAMAKPGEWIYGNRNDDGMMECKNGGVVKDFFPETMSYSNAKPDEHHRCPFRCEPPTHWNITHSVTPERFNSDWKLFSVAEPGQ